MVPGQEISIRPRAWGDPSRRNRRGALQADGVDVDRDAMIVRLYGRRVPITPQEFLLLTLLMENAGRVMTRSELLDRIWGPGRGRDSNTLAVFTSRLRRKLRRPDGSSRIRTVRGVGYVFDESAD